MLFPLQCVNSAPVSGGLLHSLSVLSVPLSHAWVQLFRATHTPHRPGRAPNIQINIQQWLLSQ